MTWRMAFSVQNPVKHMGAVGRGQVAHFAHMLFPDDAAKAGIAGFFYQQNPKSGIFVQQFTGRQGAKRTSHERIALFC
jgi:hypothetical protein